MKEDIDYENTYVITVSGDSYYKQRIKRQSHFIYSDALHNYSGILNHRKGLVFTKDEAREILFDIAMDCEEYGQLKKIGDETYELDTNQIEDDLVYYKIVSLQSLLYSLGDEALIETMLEKLYK